MEVLHVLPDRTDRLRECPAGFPADGYVWLDAVHEEVAADPEAFRATVERLTRARIFDLHLQDAVNLQHPSFFDGTLQYDMLIFRKLAPGEAPPLEEHSEAHPHAEKRHRHGLQEIVTRPITFFLFDRAIVTVRNLNSKTIDQMKTRLLEPRTKLNSSIPDKLRSPAKPEELMLRLLNGMVDRYLELRTPLTQRLDRWQRELLDPRRPFSNWIALLDARIEIRKLENLCEEQYDALQELRDSYLESTPQAQHSDAFLVRLTDVMEHVQRVLSHARRLEASAESAVALHFSATAHRTNQVVRTLTVITAVFAPLTLITGIFGMNFEFMPLLKQHDGFWITIAAMAALALLLLIYFWAKRFIADRPGRTRRERWFG